MLNYRGHTSVGLNYVLAGNFYTNKNIINHLPPSVLIGYVGSREETHTFKFNLAKQELHLNLIPDKTNIIDRNKVLLPLSVQYDIKLIIENSI